MDAQKTSKRERTQQNERIDIQKVYPIWEREWELID